MEPQKRADIFLLRGDSATINFTLTNTDLSGSTVFFTAKPALTDDADDTTAVITKETTSHTNPTAGETAIILTPEDTDVEPGTYYYDIQVVIDVNTIISIPARKLIVYADVTRRVS